MQEWMMKGAVIGGLAGISGVANVVDEQYLKKRLGFKRRDSTYSSFVRGSLIGLVGAVALAYVKGNTTALDMFGLGSPMHIKDMRDESPSSHKGEKPHVAKPLNPPQDYIWAESADSRYLVIDPKYAL
jgi:hypothetical protein